MNEIALPIATVTVFEDRARVVRRGASALATGLQRVIVLGVAPVIADKTVIARAEGATVLDARVIRAVAPWRMGEADARGAATELTERIATRDRAAIAARAATARADSVALAAQAAIEAQLRAAHELAATAAEGVAVATAATRLEQVAAVVRTHHQAAARAAADAATAAEELARLEAQVAELERGAITHTARIEIDLDVAIAGPIALEVGYVVPGACWRPYHTATWRDATLSWSTDACVWQATGEDWSDVELMCSTARPSLGASPPTLVDDLLRVQPKAALVATARDENIATTGLGGARPAEQVPGIDDGGQPRQLVAPGRTSVVADGRPHRVRLGAWTSPLEVAYVAFPERAAAVIVRTRAHNQGPHPLLAGPVDLVRDGGYTGRTSILYVAPGERFELGWGAEPSLRLHRTQREQRESSGVLGSWNQVRHRIAIRLSNLGPEPRTITVTERIPVSELADKVEIVLRPVEAWQLEDDDGALRDRTPRVTARTAGDHGMVSWQVELPSRQRRAIAHEYLIKFHDSVGGL